MTQAPQRDSCVVFNTATFQQRIADLSRPFTERFGKINRSHLLFHSLFAFLLSVEFLFFALFFEEIVKTVVMAFWLAGFFLTLFTYLVLHFYMQGRRPEKLAQLRDEFIETVQTSIPFDPGTLEYHCCITEAIVHLTGELRIPPVENRFVQRSETLSYLAEKFRTWTRWKNLLQLKEMLILSSIHEHIRLIKSAPADLEAHASLASNYVALATLYQDPKKLTLNESLTWTPPEYESEEIREKFERALERALEEYQIINEYAPNDPWVHAQRATIYKELGRLDHEQEEYERILELDPENKEILHRLGRLYFRKGENAKGLLVYEQVRAIDPEVALEIIAHYDAYSVEAYTI